MIGCQRPEPAVAAVRSSRPHPLLSQGVGHPTRVPRLCEPCRPALVSRAAA